MKKMLALILSLVLCLSLLAACGSGKGDENANAPAASFMAGYGKAKITPDEPVAMGGYGRSDKRISKGLLSDLYATCIAITDADGNTVLLYGLDLTEGNFVYTTYAGDVSEATGVPVENICMSASHSHSCPDLGAGSAQGVTAARKVVKQGLIDAAVAAMEDRKPATMSGGSIETSGLNFVRHYICNDGSYAGANFGSGASGYKEHTTQADPLLQVVKFTREGDNDIYLTNFQTHPHRTGGSDKFDISADIVGAYRDAMESELGCEVVYFSGAGGNINPTSRINKENITKDFKEQGQALAGYAKKIEFTPIATGKVQVSWQDFTGEVNHEWDSMTVYCSDLRNRWNKGEIETDELIEIAKSYGLEINSPYHAGAIVSRAKLEKTVSFSVATFSFGDVGFVVAPLEMFDATGVYIRKESPFQVTFIATCANGANGYFPTEFAFDHGCYEADTCKYVRGTTEKLADLYVQMLTAIHATK